MKLLSSRLCIESLLTILVKNKCIVRAVTDFFHFLEIFHKRLQKETSVGDFRQSLQEESSRGDVKNLNAMQIYCY